MRFSQLPSGYQVVRSKKWSLLPCGGTFISVSTQLRRNSAAHTHKHTWKYSHAVNWSKKEEDSWPLPFSKSNWSNSLEEASTKILFFFFSLVDDCSSRSAFLLSLSHSPSFCASFIQTDRFTRPLTGFVAVYSEGVANDVFTFWRYENEFCLCRWFASHCLQTKCLSACSTGFQIRGQLRLIIELKCISCWWNW